MAQPVFLHSAPAQRRDSLGNPLLGFDPTTRLFPTAPPAASRPGAPLWGFPASLQRSRRREFTSRRLPGRAARFCRESIGRSHAADYGAVLGFPNLSTALFLSPPLHHFQMDDARGIYPSGDYSFHEAPEARRHRHALLTFLPRVALSPFLGGDILGLTGRLPRMRRPGVFRRLQGLRLRENRSASSSHD